MKDMSEEKECRHLRFLVLNGDSTGTLKKRKYRICNLKNGFMLKHWRCDKKNCKVMKQEKDMWIEPVKEEK